MLSDQRQNKERWVCYQLSYLDNISDVLQEESCLIYYYIMQAISQQPDEDYVRALKTEARSEQFLALTLMTIHQLDSTYYGEINKSYQKEGFGILHTLPFQLYFGFWKNNRPEGLGLVLFPTGECIYGEFNRTALAGMGVVDDGKFLRLGVFQGVDLVGVGFEYTFATTKWRMLKYVKGSPVEQLREEVQPLDQGIPDMISAQHSLYILLSNYLQGRFFLVEPKLKKGKGEPEDKYSKLNEILVSKKEEYLALGLRDEGGLHGIAAIINRKDRSLVETGYYVAGKLEGYCLQNADGSCREIGPYFSGVRHGSFLRYSNRGTQAVQFGEDKYLGESTLSEQQIVKRQKSYNFEQKDFLSAKNNIDFTHLFQLFTPPEARHHPSQSSNSKPLSYQPLHLQAKAAAVRKGQKRQLLQKQRISHTYLHEAEKETERSCLDMMRQKMRGYDMVRTQKNARLNSEEKRKRILDSNLHMLNDEEESIAEQENPFDNAMKGLNLLHQSPKRRR